MASTNKTPNLGLSQFQPLDKPAWLGDYNQDMSKIDTAVHNNQTKVDSMETNVNVAISSADAATKAAQAATEAAAEATSVAQNAQTTANNVSGTATQALGIAQQAQETAESVRGNLDDVVDALNTCGAGNLTIAATKGSASGSITRVNFSALWYYDAGISTKRESGYGIAVGSFALDSGTQMAQFTNIMQLTCSNPSFSFSTGCTGMANIAGSWWPVLISIKVNNGTGTVNVTKFVGATPPSGNATAVVFGF